jgi:hypothetical protein
MFEIGELAILNEKVERDLPTHSGDLVTITRIVTSSPNYQYDVELPNGDYTPVRECELNKVSDKKKKIITFVKVGHHVEYIPTNEVVLILKTDFLHGMAEVEFEDAGIQVVRMIALRKIEKEVDSVEDLQQGKFTEIALEIGKFTDKKNKQYGSSVDATQKMIEVLMERYTYDDENYLMPKSLLQHILLTVRVMDKQNRIFNNPSGEGDSESPWTDITGYGLIGIDMVATK